MNTTGRLAFFYLNIGHFLDHLFMLIFATAAALALTAEWGLEYAQLIPYATPGFIAFGIGAIPAGWLADRWSRQGMMTIFFFGIGLSAILAGLTNDPFQMAVCLTLVGLFAAIYHPVGLALVVQGRNRTGIPLAINGIYGNMGVACAALLTGFLIDVAGWRQAFIVPGVLSIVAGFGFLGAVRRAGGEGRVSPQSKASEPAYSRKMLIRVFSIVLITTGLGGLIFQSTTFALPKVFDERLAGFANSATAVGGYAFIVFTLAAFAQLLVGYLVDRYSIRLVFAAVASLQAIFLFAMTWLSGFAALLVALAFMLAVFGQIPINDVLVGRIARSEWRARAYGLRYVVTFSVMASAVPLIGWIHGGWGFEALFPLLALAALLILAAVLVLPGRIATPSG